jgi:t-SNARE complex subunit (syntaxin)
VLKLCELFRDLAALVDLQQESLNVIEVQNHVTLGAEEVRQARRWQTTSRKCQVGLCLCLLLLLAAILVPVLLLVRQNT